MVQKPRGGHHRPHRVGRGRANPHLEHVEDRQKHRTLLSPQVVAVKLQRSNAGTDMPAAKQDPLAGARAGAGLHDETPSCSCSASWPLRPAHPTTSPQAGRALFAQNCVQCHGTDARGGDTVPDLTGLALRAGGPIPRTMVLDKLDGYARGQAAMRGSDAAIRLPADRSVDPRALPGGMSRECPKRSLRSTATCAVPARGD